MEAKLPGYTKIVAAAEYQTKKAELVNWMVGLLNLADESVSEANPNTAAALAAASAALAAENAEAGKIAAEQPEKS